MTESPAETAKAITSARDRVWPVRVFEMAKAARSMARAIADHLAVGENADPALYAALEAWMGRAGSGVCDGRLLKRGG